jgi:hypothetical protein
MCQEAQKIHVILQMHSILGQNQWAKSRLLTKAVLRETQI